MFRPSWSWLFLLIPIFGVAWFVFAINEWPPLAGHWFPQDISAHGNIIDSLFNTILWLTGAIFVGTGIAMFLFLHKYDASYNADPVKYVHGSHVLEVVWSIIPAATLLFIAIYQMSAWANAKVLRPNQPALAEVTGRQFEWRIRYAGEDKIIGTEDDVFTVNDLHVPLNEDVVLAIKSDDVLHSFFLPNLRLKQDVVPGMKQFVWFKPLYERECDIVCAELCGWGHYKMKGRLNVVPRQEFNQWLANKRAEQETSSFTPPAIEEDDES
ncbi:MAG: cytochrome c oxidase subunit II [Planctomycetota bacterium]|nr:cytochrome c oxidase subunit II [Planctomycetota bacterium]